MPLLRSICQITEFISLPRQDVRAERAKRTRSAQEMYIGKKKDVFVAKSHQTVKRHAFPAKTENTHQALQGMRFHCPPTYIYWCEEARIVRERREQNRVRLIERRGARLHSISDGKPIPYEYQSKGTLGMRHNSVLFHHVHGGRTASSL